MRVEGSGTPLLAAAGWTRNVCTWAAGFRFLNATWYLWCGTGGPTGPTYVRSRYLRIVVLCYRKRAFDVRALVERPRFTKIVGRLRLYERASLRLVENCRM